MCPDRDPATTAADRRGFALPFALFALLTVMMLVAVVLDVAVGELRTARGGLAAARASAAVQTALAGVVDAPSDSNWVGGAVGAVRTTTTGVNGDTVGVALQRLGASHSRIVVHAVSHAGGVLGAAGAVAFVEIVPDATAPTGARFRRLTGWWWVPTP